MSTSAGAVFVAKKGPTNQRVFQLAKEQGWPVRELRKDVRTLETVFNELANYAG